LIFGAALACVAVIEFIREGILCSWSFWSSPEVDDVSVDYMRCLMQRPGVNLSDLPNIAMRH